MVMTCIGQALYVRDSLLVVIDGNIAVRSLLWSRGIEFHLVLSVRSLWLASGSRKAELIDVGFS